MNYNEAFEKMVSEMKLVEGITISKKDFYLKEEFLPDFLNKNSFLKPYEEEIRALNDNSFFWNYTDKKGNMKPMGEFHFLAVTDILSSKPNFSNDQNANEEKTILSELLPFDDHPESGDGIMGCLRFAKNKDEVWLHTENGETFQMQLDLKGYLEKILELKALFGWQYLFAEINWSFSVYSVIKSDLVQRINIMSKCFPQFQSQGFLKKFK